MRHFVLPVLFITSLFISSGCSESPVAPEPHLVEGKWQGVFYESSTWTSEMFLVADGTTGVGVSRFYLGGGAYFQAFPVKATIAGDIFSFAMLLDFGPGQSPWRMTGFVNGKGEMCLNRDLYGDDTWCMAPVVVPELDVSDK